jgi:hypothetical protein
MVLKTVGSCDYGNELEAWRAECAPLHHDREYVQIWKEGVCDNRDEVGTHVLGGTRGMLSTTAAVLQVAV